MPAPTPVVGVEFQAVSIANGDSGTLTLFATVTNAGGNFSMRQVQAGARTGVVRFTRDDAQVFNFNCTPGSRVLIANNTAFARTWTQFRAGLSISGGAR